MKLYFALAVALISISFSAAAEAQTFKYGNGKTLEMQFVEVQPCWLKLDVESAQLTDADADKHWVSLKVSNESEMTVRAFTLISTGKTRRHITTEVFPRLESGQKANVGLWPDSQEHIYLLFDHVLFADGSTCGPDSQHRAASIKKFFDDRQAAVAHVKEMMGASPDAAEILTALENEASGFITFDPIDSSDKKSALPFGAWAQVAADLKHIGERYPAAAEIGERFEKELPKAPAQVKGSSATGRIK